MKINDLISNFEIFITNEEKQLLKKINGPVRLLTLTDREQVIAESMIRKSLLKKIGFENPYVLVNEKASD